MGTRPARASRVLNRGIASVWPARPAASKSRDDRGTAHTRLPPRIPAARSARPPFSGQPPQAAEPLAYGPRLATTAGPTSADAPRTERL
eukprot:3952952-Prymnesium_polylepis.2